MKTRILLLVLLLLSLFLVAAFILPKEMDEQEMSENDGIMLSRLPEELNEPEELNGERITPVDFEYFDSINISMEKLQFTKYGKKYQIEGHEIEEDKGLDYSAAYAVLMKQIECGEICIPPSIEVSVNFVDEIPETVTFYNDIYMNQDGRCKYPSLQRSYNFHPTEEPIELTFGESMRLTFGLDLSRCLESDSRVIQNSNSGVEKYYRVFRIVCKFEKKTMEYYLVCK